MCYYISTVKVNKLFHLQNLEIPISEKNPHLIITGKNGSGKTILIKAIADFLELVRTDNDLSYLRYDAPRHHKSHYAGTFELLKKQRSFKLRCF